MQVMIQNFFFFFFFLGGWVVFHNQGSTFLQWTIWELWSASAKEVCALWVLLVCLFVCGQHYSKSYERIGMKFYGRVLSSTKKNWLNFGGDLGIVRWVNEQKNTVIVVAYPDCRAGNDPEPFFFFFFRGWVVFRNQGSTFLQWAIWE